MKSIRAPKGVPHLCYCHSPARYVWDQTEDYAHGAGGRVRSLGLGAVRGRMQRWDRRTAAGVTRFIANSRHTADRIQRCYGREATVIHPPVRTAFFTPDDRVEREDWLLVVSALEPYKRVDLVLEAARRRNLPVVVAGDGTQARALAAIGGPGATFAGRVDDLGLRALYRRARAAVFPQVEDFGIATVEAQAAGCPVVALRAGGSLDAASPETAVYFERQTVDDLCGALDELADRAIDSAACRAHAERFSEDRFDAAIVEAVDQLLS